MKIIAKSLRHSILLTMVKATVITFNRTFYKEILLNRLIMLIIAYGPEISQIKTKIESQ